MHTICQDCTIYKALQNHHLIPPNYRFGYRNNHSTIHHAFPNGQHLIYPIEKTTTLMHSSMSLKYLTHGSALKPSPRVNTFLYFHYYISNPRILP